MKALGTELVEAVPLLQVVPQSPALEVMGLSKRFGDFVALEDVSLQVKRGTIHALLGENGAGKSTLVKCIMGFYHPDRGSVRIQGEVMQVKSPREAVTCGLGMVYQHFTLVDELSVTENLILAQPRTPFLLDLHKEESRVREFMRAMPFQLDPCVPVGTLSAGEKQKLEILKQLFLGSRIIILDEPTSVLTPTEADEVLGLLKEMTRNDQLTLLLITHKFREVMNFCDEVTVLRRGRLVGGGKVADLNPATMAEMMVGEAPPRVEQEKSHAAPGETVLRITSLHADDDLGIPALQGISLEVRAGEIVGIAGVSGNGQAELVEVLAGQRAPIRGNLEVRGVPFKGTRADLHRHGVRCLPDEPLKNACVATSSVADNMAFRVYDRRPFSFLRTFVKLGAIRKKARAWIEEYGIRAPSENAPIGSLSGGNVQRAVLARELMGGANLLVASNPCFGLDFAAVAEIRTRLLASRNQGTAVLLISADLEELMALSDRLLVMCDGEIVYEAPTQDAQIGIVGRAMAGHGA